MTFIYSALLRKRHLLRSQSTWWLLNHTNTLYKSNRGATLTLFRVKQRPDLGFMLAGHVASLSAYLNGVKEGKKKKRITRALSNSAQLYGSLEAQAL